MMLWSPIPAPNIASSHPKAIGFFPAFDPMFRPAFKKASDPLELKESVEE
jgi:hypothetical protein